MAVNVNNANPSTLAGVLRQIVEAMSAMGDGTAVMVGKGYVGEFGTHDPPCVLFVPESGPGKIGPPMETGYAASRTHVCDFAVRAADTGDDIGRLDAAYSLEDLVIDLIGTACTGRIKWGEDSDDSPFKVGGVAGVGFVGRFEYTRDVPHSAARHRLAGATADTAPPANPAYPQAVFANEPIALVVVTTPPVGA